MINATTEIYILYFDISISRGNAPTKVAKEAPAPTRTKSDGRPQHINVDAEAKSVK
jgi:hypothetical protein